MDQTIAAHPLPSFSPRKEWRYFIFPRNDKSQNLNTVYTIYIMDRFRLWNSHMQGSCIPIPFGKPMFDFFTRCILNSKKVQFKKKSYLPFEKYKT